MGWDANVGKKGGSRDLKRNSSSNSSDRQPEKLIFSGYYGTKNQPTMAEQQHAMVASTKYRELELVFF